jgi:ketosteroid isomerase-like protein
VRFKGLERALVEAGQEKNQQTLSRLVAEDFEERSAERIDPTPRELWEQNWTSANVTWFQIRDMGVHDFGDTAVVSFLLDRRGQAGGKALPATVFIVDVWRKAEGKVAVRYVSTPGKPAGAELMPTGKE